MGLTIAELVNFCNDNGISLDTELTAMGATVKYIGYSKAKNVVTLDEECGDTRRRRLNWRQFL